MNPVVRYDKRMFLSWSKRHTGTVTVIPLITAILPIDLRRRIRHRICKQIEIPIIDILCRRVKFPIHGHKKENPLFRAKYRYFGEIISKIVGVFKNDIHMAWFWADQVESNIYSPLSDWWNDLGWSEKEQASVSLLICHRPDYESISSLPTSHMITLRTPPKHHMIAYFLVTM